jgi:hypothetical protein
VANVEGTPQSDRGGGGDSAMKLRTFSSGWFRFGPCELKLPSGELRLNGATQRLADQPLAVHDGRGSHPFVAR